MALLRINNDARTLELRLSLAGALLSVKFVQLMEFPLENIRLPIIIKPPEAKKKWKGWGYGGLPGLSTGTFWSSDSSRTKSFHHFRNPDRTILITLRNDHYNQLILEVNEDTTPEEFAEELRHTVEEYTWEFHTSRRYSTPTGIST